MQGTFFFGVEKCCEAVAERFITHRDFVGKKFGFYSGDTAHKKKPPKTGAVSGGRKILQDGEFGDPGNPFFNSRRWTN